MAFAGEGCRDKEKMYRHAFLAGVRDPFLLTMGVLGLQESRKDDDPEWL